MTTSTIQLKRGLSVDKTSVTPAVGEPIYLIDTKELRIGDGSTAGGVAIAVTDTTIASSTIDNTTIGATTPSTGAFTTLTSDIAIQRNRIDADLTVPDGYNMLSIAPIEINPDATITLAGNATWRII